MTALVVLLALPTSWLAVGAVLRWLQRQQILDHPNERSSHRRPTPRGGGLAVTPILLIGLTLLAIDCSSLAGERAVLPACALLLLLSWRDDRASLPAGLRFGLQAVAVAVGILSLPAPMQIFQGLLPLWADRLLGAIAWLWFVNLYNFMDGIDGITVIETSSLAAGFALLGQFIPQSVLLIAVSLGFLRWNWHPAKIFLGDSGSIPLGFLLGWLLLLLAGGGHWAAALILPAYYWADATLTLLRRAVRGEKIWQAHRQHAYQRAVQAGAGHDQVTLTILAINLLLIGAAWWSEAQPWPALGLAVVVTGASLFLFSRFGKQRRAGK